MDCFASLAMTAPITNATSRLAAQSARVVHLSLAPLEGVGNAGCLMHPRPRVHFVLVERTRVTTSTPERPAFPHAMVLRLMSCSPVTGRGETTRKRRLCTAHAISRHPQRYRADFKRTKNRTASRKLNVVACQQLAACYNVASWHRPLPIANCKTSPKSLDFRSA